jgi:hypothetical protein
MRPPPANRVVATAPSNRAVATVPAGRDHSEKEQQVIAAKVARKPAASLVQSTVRKSTGGNDQ